MAQDRDQWRALVKTLLIHGVPKKGGKILDKLGDYQLLKRDSAPWS
jgi:hypothetical protein